MDRKIERNKRELENNILHTVFAVLDKSNIVIPNTATINIYHHCGRENFQKTGAVFINIVNRDYCKSYVVMIPNQQYPCHYHKIKTETFYVLYGMLGVTVDEMTYQLKAGEMINIERGQNHMFWSDSGVVFEEISTMYTQNDSFYLDMNIQRTSYAQRRTTITAKEWKELYGKWKK